MENHLWNWNLHIPLKIKIFGWRSKHTSPPPQILRSHIFRILDHLFLLCDFVKLLWRHLPTYLSKKSYKFYDFFWLTTSTFGDLATRIHFPVLLCIQRPSNGKTEFWVPPPIGCLKLNYDGFANFATQYAQDFEKACEIMREGWLLVVQIS